MIENVWNQTAVRDMVLIDPNWINKGLYWLNWKQRDQSDILLTIEGPNKSLFYSVIYFLVKEE